MLKRNCVISSATVETIFTMSQAKLYAPVVTLPTQDNAKPLQQSLSDFKRTISSNKYYSKSKADNKIIRLIQAFKV